jgi:Domain of unknown function (DUF222)
VTTTANPTFEAVVRDADCTVELGGGGGVVDIVGDGEPLTPAFCSVASQVGAAPNLFEALVYPNETAACLAQLAPSAAVLDVLLHLAPGMLDVDGQLDAVVAVQRHIGLLHAREAELLAALDAGDDSVDGFTRETVAAALRVPPASMRTKMTAASDLTGRLPGALALLRAGGITQRHAIDLVDATRALTPALAAVVEDRVLRRAVEQTSTQFRASAKRAVLKVSDPAHAERAHTQAVSERRVIVTPTEDGMAELWALLPAEGAATIKTTLDAMAYTSIHGAGGDTRTADQRRADALIDLAITALHGPAVSKGHGQRPAVQVTVAASTLMGLDEQPAELDGYGPITAAMARRIATDPTALWRRLLTDDDGRVLSAGIRTYRPPADLARTVIARDQHCVFPGCRKKADHNDLDHVHAYHPGDDTTTANLMSLCRRHHRLKHTGTWTVTRDDHTGVTTWTDPHRRQYRTRPPTRPTTTQTAKTSPPPTPTPDMLTDADPPPF